MELFDNLKLKLADEHQARVASSNAIINKMKQQNDEDETLIKIATHKSSKNKISSELLNQMKMGIQLREDLIENVVWVHQQMQHMQPSLEFVNYLKEDILVRN